MNIEQIWKNAQKNIMDKSSVSAINFDLWIKTMIAIEFNDGVFTLMAESRSGKNYATGEKLFSEIEREIKEVAPIVEKVTIIDAAQQEEREAIKKGEPIRDKETYASKFITPNPTKTFDTFIVGRSNEYVSAAAEAVAKAPGERINPLFIYGGSGLGKTHLLNAIANYISSNNPKLKIAFATCEKFVSDFVDAMAFKKNSVASLRENYRNIDVLLIDDIHDIENKTGTQEEFFHTFNDLYQNGKQIVLTSDRHADKFQSLTERMRSRFKSGLIQDITSPDVEMRMAILQKKASLENQKLEPEIIKLLAERAFENQMNIRDMEGILQKVIFYAGLKGRDRPAIEDCYEALGGQERSEVKKVNTTADTIISAVCKYFNIKKDDLIGKKRSREIVEPRMITIYLITEILNIPLVNIGKLIGNRDHTTIMHGRNKIEGMIKTDARIKRIVDDLRGIVEG
ncbi:MAG: chromosomal replication initiator protein DnaA [Firmicutes bacterium]|nr:chromosomal replication initiator protein DnaA [Bacillota bacterium]